MIRNIVRIIGILLLFCSISNCNKKAEVFFDEAQEKEEILKMAGERFKRMMATDNPKEIARIYTENTVETPVYMPQNDTILIGRDAIRKWGEKFFGKYQLTVGTPKEGLYDEWLITPKLAVHRYDGEGYFINRATKDSVFTSQKTVDVFKKENGEWLYSSHTWNTNNTDIAVFNAVCDTLKN